MELASPVNNWHYNKSLQPYANSLRKQMTKSESCLWKFALRARQMKGYQFRRQRPVLDYIADFMCQPLLLVVEVDGYTHQFEEVYSKDLQKDQDLRNVGFKVLRFRDEEVLEQMGWVKSTIWYHVEEREKELGLT